MCAAQPLCMHLVAAQLRTCSSSLSFWLLLYAQLQGKPLLPLQQRLLLGQRGLALLLQVLQVCLHAGTALQEVKGVEPNCCLYRDRLGARTPPCRWPAAQGLARWTGPGPLNRSAAQGVARWTGLATEQCLLHRAWSAGKGCWTGLDLTRPAKQG